MMQKKDVGGGIPLKEIAELVGAEIFGSADVLVKCATSFDSPEAGGIAFSSEKNERRLLDQLPESPLHALIVNPTINTEVLPKNISYLKVKQPYGSFIDIIPLFYSEYPRPQGIHQMASVDPTAKVGKNVSIDAFVSIGAGAIIGDNTRIYANATVYPEAVIGSNVTIHSGAVVRERCVIGNDVIIQNGAVIGGDGFGYIPDAKLGVRTVPQVGRALLADRVEIGVNACIDRGAFSDTTIGFNTKIDNLVQIGHNVSIGQFSFVCGTTAVAGSAKIGNQVTIGGNSSIAGHLEICDGVRLTGQSSITHTIRTAGDYGGFPAQPVMKWRRQMAAIRKLPSVMAELRKSGLIKSEEDESK